MENENELQDSPQPDETTVETAEPTLEDYQELAKKNKELFARAKKAEEMARKAKLEPAPNKSAEPDPKLNERLERIELQTKGYSDEEIDFMLPLGGKKAIENEFVKAAIESKRQQKRAEAATVDTDSAKSDIEKKYSAEQIANMSVAEMEKILPRA